MGGFYAENATNICAEHSKALNATKHLHKSRAKSKSEGGGNLCGFEWVSVSQKSAACSTEGVNVAKYMQNSLP